MKFSFLNPLRAFAAGLIFTAALAGSAGAQITEKATFGPTAITNATIHTVTNGVISGGTVLLDGHRITAVGRDVAIPSGYTVIDGTGKHVYPGFIDSGTRLGLIEISAVPVTVDDAEVGQFNPQMRAFTAINPNSAAIPVTRVSGVTNVISHPTSGVVSGKATLIDLFGYSPDSMAVRADAALHIEWPTQARRGWGDNRSDEDRRKAYERGLAQLQDYWDNARSYHEMWVAFEADPAGKRRPDRNPEMHGMRDVFAGKLPVMVSVDRENDIRSALEWIGRQPDAVEFILSSVAEGWRVADDIAAAGIPVLVGPMLRTPVRAYDDFRRPYENAGLLAQAGVVIAIRTGQTENVRNLPYNASYAAVYGLGVEEALRAVTINPARIFGVETELGSIEVGKRANLFISDGDPFEPATQIEAVFINGYNIPMMSRQTMLYDEFLQRTP